MRRVRRAGPAVVIVNASPTPYDEPADAVIREPISAVLPGLVTGA
jgi:NAD-dependent deacetylase